MYDEYELEEPFKNKGQEEEEQELFRVTQCVEELKERDAVAFQLKPTRDATPL